MEDEGLSSKSTPVALVLVGGFLGAGKTSAIVALARHWRAMGHRVAVIANDQAADLVDTATFQSQDLPTAEVAGGCFCCRFDDFIARAGELVAAHAPDIILGEPVGSCTDLVATIINPIKQLIGGRFTVRPLVVLLDAPRALKMLAKTTPVGLSERVTYIFDMQQREAEAIVLNKIDLLSPVEATEVQRLVRARFPDRPILAISATRGDRIGELAEWLTSAAPGPVALRDLDYDIYAAGEAELGWLNSHVVVECDTPFDLDAVLLSLAGQIQGALRDRRLEIAHAKLRIEGAGAAALVSIVDSVRPVQLSRSAAVSAVRAELTINLRVQSEPIALSEALRQTFDKWTEDYGLVATSGSGQAFSPSRPVPTHRFAL